MATVNLTGVASAATTGPRAVLLRMVSYLYPTIHSVTNTGIAVGSVYDWVAEVPCYWHGLFRDLPGWSTVTTMDVPDGQTNAYAAACNDDGSVMVGWAGAWDTTDTAFPCLWQPDGSVTVLADAGIAQDVSADGSIIVGTTVESGTGYLVATRWVDTVQDVLAAPAGSYGRAYCCSADGRVITGVLTDFDALPWTMVQWTDGVLAMLPITDFQLVGERDGLITCSSDGNKIQYHDNAYITHVYDVAANTDTFLDGDGRAYDISGDGSIQVGWHWDAGSEITSPVIWRDGELTTLSTLSSGAYGEIDSISRDGTVAAGWQINSLGDSEPLLWDVRSGIVLASESPIITGAASTAALGTVVKTVRPPALGVQSTARASSVGVHSTRVLLTVDGAQSDTNAGDASVNVLFADFHPAVITPLDALNLTMGGNLFAMAARKYHTADQWIRILEANNMTDPFLTTTVPINIIVPSKANPNLGGIPSHGFSIPMRF